VTTILSDARFGLRLLLKHPGFTTVAVLALALGVAANTAIFSVVYATLLAPMPYPDPDQLVMVWSRIQGNRNVTATADYLEWKRRATVFQDLNAWTGRSMNLATAERPEQVDGRATTPGFLRMLGTGFTLGRDFVAEEAVPGRDHVVILTNRTWRERFGGDPAILGRGIRVNGVPHVVVGVLAPGWSDKVESGVGSIYVPLAFTPDQINHDFHWLLVMGRLKPGVSLAQANANMRLVSQQIAREYPKSNTGWASSVEPLKNNFLGDEIKSALWFMLGAVAFVLLIACVNVANLLLARGMARQREIAVRAAIGAERRRIFTQFLTESTVLAVGGGLLGIVLAWGLVQVIVALMPSGTLPSEADVRLNVPVLLFTLLASCVSGVLFGCVPAWQATRTDVNQTLKEGARANVGGRNRASRVLVAAEVALALMLLAGGGLALHGLFKASRVDLGFRTDHLLTFYLPVPEGRLKNAAQVETFYRGLLDRVRALPGVAATSVSTGMPVYGTSFGMPFDIAGKPSADPSKRPGAGFNQVSPDFFQAFGIRMTRGRAFSEQDSAGSVPVAVVNDTFVKRYLKGVDPLTQRLVIEQLIPGVTKLGPAVEWQIVGVYENVRNAGPQGTGFPEIDVPFWQSSWPTALMAVRTTGDPSTIQKSVAAIVQSVDPDLPLASVKTMDQVVYESLSGPRFGSVLLGVFAGIALLLAVFGIYGVMSFIVAQRTHEIGLRMALGADRRRVLGHVVRDGMVTSLIGVVLGAAGAYGIGRMMQGLWSGIDALDPVALASVTALLVAAALVACVVPARRAASLDPMVALREE
jgi:predicted permease